MEHFQEQGYPMGHETPRDIPAVGAAAPTGHPPAGIRSASVGSGASVAVRQEFGVSMADDLPLEGSQGAAPASHPGTPLSALVSPEAGLGDQPLGGRAGPWVPDRSVDAGAHRGRDSEKVSSVVPPQPCVVVAARHGLELSAAGAARPPTGRAGHRPLEALSVAAYKKTRIALRLTWFSSTRAASCSSPTLSAPGHPEGTPRMPGISTNRATSPPSVRWRSRPGGAVWRCTSGSKAAASMGWMSAGSSGSSCDTSAARWSCSGTKARSIGVRPCRRSSASTPGFSLSTSRRTPRNSTRLSTSGVRATVGWPTAPRRMWRNSTASCEPPSSGRAAPRTCSGRASMPRTCHGLIDESFLYLYETQ